MTFTITILLYSYDLEKNIENTESQRSTVEESYKSLRDALADIQRKKSDKEKLLKEKAK